MIFDYSLILINYFILYLVVANEELRRLYRRPVIASDAHSDTEIIDLAQSTDLDDTTSKAPVIDLVDDGTGPGERVWDGADSRKRPLQSSSAPIQNNSSSNSSAMSGAKKRKMQNENANHVLPTVFIPLMCPTPKSLAWTNIAYNVRCDDEPVLRYVPYFGDDDVTGVDVSAYDLVPGELEVSVTLIYFNQCLTCIILNVIIINVTIFMIITITIVHSLR